MAVNSTIRLMETINRLSYEQTLRDLEDSMEWMRICMNPDNWPMTMTIGKDLTIVTRRADGKPFE
jgi:hypothetical protein